MNDSAKFRVNAKCYLLRVSFFSTFCVHIALGRLVSLAAKICAKIHQKLCGQIMLFVDLSIFSISPAASPSNYRCALAFVKGNADCDNTLFVAF